MMHIITNMHHGIRPPFADQSELLDDGPKRVNSRFPGSREN